MMMQPKNAAQRPNHSPNRIYFPVIMPMTTMNGPCKLFNIYACDYMVLLHACKSPPVHITYIRRVAKKYPYCRF